MKPSTRAFLPEPGSSLRRRSCRGALKTGFFSAAVLVASEGSLQVVEDSAPPNSFRSATAEVSAPAVFSLVRPELADTRDFEILVLKRAKLEDIFKVEEREVPGVRQEFLHFLSSHPSMQWSGRTAGVALASALQHSHASAVSAAEQIQRDF